MTLDVPHLRVAKLSSSEYRPRFAWAEIWVCLYQPSL